MSCTRYAVLVQPRNTPVVSELRCLVAYIVFCCYKPRCKMIRSVSGSGVAQYLLICVRFRANRVIPIYRMSIMSYR